MWWLTFLAFSSLSSTLTRTPALPLCCPSSAPALAFPHLCPRRHLLPRPPLVSPRRTKKCTCNKPWSGAGCDVNRAYGRRSFFGCHLQPLPPAITEVCNTAINVQQRCPGYRLLAYSLCNHTCPLVENFGCGIGNVSHVCADPLIKCPDLVR